MVFVNLTKAYESVPRRWFWKEMHKLETPIKLIEVTKNMNKTWGKDKIAQWNFEVTRYSVPQRKKSRSKRTRMWSQWGRKDNQETYRGRRSTCDICKAWEPRTSMQGERDKESLSVLRGLSINLGLSIRVRQHSITDQSRLVFHSYSMYMLLNKSILNVDAPHERQIGGLVYVK